MPLKLTTTKTDTGAHANRGIAPVFKSAYQTSGAIHCSYSPTPSSHRASLYLTAVQFLSCVRSSLLFLLRRLTSYRHPPLSSFHAPSNARVVALHLRLTP